MSAHLSGAASSGIFLSDPMTKPPITASEIPQDWPAQVAAAKPMPKLRAGDHNTIEALSPSRSWMAVMLPGGATSFATEEDRDLVLGAIMGLNVMPTQPAK